MDFLWYMYIWLCNAYIYDTAEISLWRDEQAASRSLMCLGNWSWECERITALGWVVKCNTRQSKPYMAINTHDEDEHGQKGNLVNILRFLYQQNIGLKLTWKALSD